MAAIVNAIFGHKSDSDEHSTTAEAKSTHSAAGGQNATGADRKDALHTSAVSGDVQVKSVISSESEANAKLNTKFNIEGLLSQLSTTHTEVDKYSRSRTAEINEDTRKSITAVLERTKKRQEDLVAAANRHHLAMNNEYKAQLQKAVEALDAVKARNLAELERDLQAKQMAIMNEAKAEIDVLNDQSNAAKLQVLAQAQEQTKKEMQNLANQVFTLGQQGAESLLQSTTTTTITSKAQAAEKVSGESAHQSGSAAGHQQSGSGSSSQSHSGGQSASGSHSSSAEHHASSGKQTTATETHATSGGAGGSHQTRH